MSAEMLREAARLMRERANAATGGAWEVIEDVHRGYSEPAREVSVWSSEGRYVTEDVSLVEGNLNQWRANAEHIASWHPAVALAVADSLEEAAAAFDSHMAKQMDPLRRFHGLWLAEAERKHERALAVARAYLNEVPS